jgi:hypothetical protein
MQRPVVGLMVLAGIALSGALGGHVMRQGARAPRPRASAPPTVPPRVELKVARAACPAVTTAMDTGCSAAATAGD